MLFIKRILFKLFSVEDYLRIVSSLFFILYRLNFLRGNQTFEYHYFVKKIVNKGDVVIDLGANLGYYSRIFSDLVGQSGKVYSIEPVELFRRILQKNCKGLSNVTILPYAIGPDDGKQVTMGVPDSGYFSHGRTHLLSENEKSSMRFEATMKLPNSILADLQELDYMKCDIEGYENVAIPLFQDIIARFRPIIQIEVAEENLNFMLSYFIGQNYNGVDVRNGVMYSFSATNSTHDRDLIFIPQEKLSLFNISKK